MLCGDLSYLERGRRASGRPPRLVISGLGVWPARIGDQDAKEVQEDGGDGFGHLGRLLGEVHVDPLGGD